MKQEDMPEILREFARMSFPSDSGRKDMPVSKGLARVQRLEAKMQAELQKKHAKYLAEHPEASATAEASPSSEEATQGPERFIGPKNPDHPVVNKDGGGRGVD
jgi:hypothetical protein